GIPYAAAPVGRMRLRSPAPPPYRADEFEASRFGAPSAQLHRDFRSGALSLGRSAEDCLSINVHSPSDRQSSLLPVMVFIHGGGYSKGSSRDFSEQGRGFIQAGPVVYVSFNYRLGPLGYLDFTQYSTARRPFESNLGLRDQVAALAWVRDNIGA